jgi:hypothetical protein
MLLGKGNHFICAGRRSAYPQAAVALLYQTARDWMKDLVESRVTDSCGTSVLDKR